MKIIYRIILLIVALTVVGCATYNSENKILNSAFYPEVSQGRKANWKNLVGTWYGSQKTKDGGKYSWIIKKNIQGLYQLEGKVMGPSGESKTQIEVGEWGVGKSIYFSIFKGWLEKGKFVASDPSDPYNRDIYKILELSETKFKYQHIDNGETFEVERVADDFKIPSN